MTHTTGWGLIAITSLLKNPMMRSMCIMLKVLFKHFYFFSLTFWFTVWGIWIIPWHLRHRPLGRSVVRGPSLQPSDSPLTPPPASPLSRIIQHVVARPWSTEGEAPTLCCYLKWLPQTHSSDMWRKLYTCTLNIDKVNKGSNIPKWI